MGLGEGRVRGASVAGSFYEGAQDGLSRQIEGCFLHELGPGSLPKVAVVGERRIIGLVSPHAGYMYSGAAAACGFHELAADGALESVIIMGPNHRGMGADVAVMTGGRWNTPLGDVEIDSQLAEGLLSACDLVEEDDMAHRFEHSIEVQLPFLQYVYGNSFQFVPICMFHQGLEACLKVGETIGKVIGDRNGLVIASTDFTHYEMAEAAQRKDKEAINCIVSLDPEGLFRTVRRLNISMCGVGPVVAMLAASKLMGAREGSVVKYYTSGDITGDHYQVVGYGSLKVLR